jgi:hypothetical protein
MSKRNKHVEPYWKYKNRLKNYDLMIFEESDGTYEARIVDVSPTKELKGFLYASKPGFKTPTDAMAYLSKEEETLPNLECPEGYHFVKRHHRNVKGNMTAVSGHCVRDREVRQ